MLGSHFTSSAKGTKLIDYSKIYTRGELELELSSAVKFNHLFVIYFLRKLGIPFTSEHLNRAVLNGNENLVSQIVKSGVELSSDNIRSLIYKGKDDIILKLIDSGVELSPDNISSLIYKGKDDFILRLIDAGVELSPDNISSLIFGDKDNLILKLIDAGVELSPDNISSLIYKGKDDFILKLVDAGFQFKYEHLKKVAANGNPLFLKLIDYGLKPSLNAYYLSIILGNEAAAYKIIESNPEFIEQIEPDLYAVSTPKLAQEVIKNYSKEKIEDLVINLFAKGHFTEAKNYFTKNNLDNTTIDPVDLVTTSIEIDIKGAIEQNKYGALVNLISRAGIHIPDQYQKYIGNINDDTPEIKFEFVHSLVHKLAEHYILLAKNDLLKQFSNDEKTVKLVDKILTKNNTAQEKYSVLEELRELHPESKYLEKAKSPFDAIYLTSGKALEKIDHDFALEVLLLNGITPFKSEDKISAYRGMNANISDQDLQDMFVYGHRAFSAAQNQKNLGYHVFNKWSKIEYDRDYIWELGGTYISMEPSWSTIYAIADWKKNNNSSQRIFLEIQLSKDEPLTFGPSLVQFEIVPARIKGDEIIAIHQLDAEKKVVKSFKNPFSEIKPRYSIGDEIIKDDDAIDNYNRILKAPKIYDNYEQFLENYIYQPERLDQFYENRPELPNQVCISPKTLSEIRLDMDVYSYMCVEE